MASDLILLLTVALYGAFGGGLYAVANKLFASKDAYFTALEHVIAGVIVALALVLVLGFQVPSGIAGSLPFIAAGYAALDLIQLIVSKLKSVPLP